MNALKLIENLRRKVLKNDREQFFPNCSIRYKKLQQTKVESKKLFFLVVKLLRAHEGCLGTNRRRRTW